MTTGAERLTLLSGLSGVSAAAHLKNIAAAAGVAGALLVSYSGLSTGTAAEHLRVDRLPDARYVGGGGSSADERERLHREHWDYIDGLREIQVRIADDVRGARTVSIRADMRIPDEVLPPAMRGTVSPTRVADVLGQPLILAALALLIDEADD